ncbi:Uncharacterised protein [Mycobacteroides abscessus]|nr:Uncharacterised protein [Mycobacteroides abscessus]SIN59466.1 Uncharacterised protein [Mycobacteroides abscessus subsp. abscessus]
MAEALQGIEVDGVRIQPSDLDDHIHTGGVVLSEQCFICQRQSIIYSGSAFGRTAPAEGCTHTLDLPRHRSDSLP